MPNHLTPSITPWQLLRALTVLLFACAVLLKLHELMTAPVPVTGPWAGRGIAVLALGFEVALIAWLLDGRWPQLLRWACCCCLGAFAAITAWLTWREAASCGCFGSLMVPPWLTLLLDVGFGAAWWLVPLPNHDPIRASRARAAAWALLALLPVVLPALGLHTPALATRANAPLALLPEELTTGSHTLIAYRSDCPSCRSDFWRWAEAARRQAAPALFGSPRPRPGQAWVFVDIGPDLPEQDLFTAAGLAGHFRRIHLPHLDLPHTPIALRLQDGRVVAHIDDPTQL